MIVYSCACFLLFLLESRVHEAGYFHAVSRDSKLAVGLVHLYEKGRGESQTAQISGAMEQIENFEVDVVLLYTRLEKIELILQQVNIVLSVFCCRCCCFSFSSYAFNL